MITVYAYKKEPNKDEYFYKYMGLSTDEKPTDKRVSVNSFFLELDTGDFYYLKSQATESKTVLLEEQSFVGVYESIIHSYTYEFDADEFNTENICVKFDGIKYECSGFNTYGAPWDDTAGTFDWSTYPFQIESDPGIVYVAVADGNQHTIEIYTESSTPAVWEKIGSGGSGPEPTGELLFSSTFITEDFGGICLATFNDVGKELNYSSIIIDFNGTRYTLDGTCYYGTYFFGASIDPDTHEVDFSEYPVAIVYDAPNVEITFATETSLTCTVKIWANSDPINSDSILGPIVDPIPGTDPTF